jgi:hypothetical protein
MVKPVVKMLASVISHMPLHTVWRESGVTKQHGFELQVDVAGFDLPGRPRIDMRDRAKLLLNGDYDLLSGLHHEPYIYRARGDKRFVYLAQAQNDWDDRVIATQEIKSARDLEGKKLIMLGRAPCVYGNLLHTLRVDGADTDKIEFVDMGYEDGGPREAVRAIARGEAAAANVDAPFDRQGEKVGLHRMDLTGIPVIHNSTMCANREWVEANEETAYAMMRSVVDAIHFFKTKPDETCAILEQHLAAHIGLEGPDEVEHLQRVWADLLSPKPYPHPLAVWNVYNLDVGHDPAVNFINPFELWDTSILRAIDDSEYIDELYGGSKEAANPTVNAVI